VADEPGACRHALEAIFHRGLLVPVVTLADPSTAVRLARRLRSGGIPAIGEVTHRSAAGVEAMRPRRAQVP